MTNLINEVSEIVSYGMIEGLNFTYKQAMEDAMLLVDNLTNEYLKNNELEIKKQALETVLNFVEEECNSKEGYDILSNAAHELMTENKAEKLIETYLKRIDGMLIEYTLD